MKTLLNCSLLSVLSNHAKILAVEGFKRDLPGEETFISPHSLVLSEGGLGKRLYPNETG